MAIEALNNTLKNTFVLDEYADADTLFDPKMTRAGRACEILDMEVIQNTLIIKLSGEFDHHITKELGRKIQKEFAAKSVKNIIFDMELVTFIDSTAIGFILGRYKEVRVSDGRLMIVNAQKPVDRVLDIVGIKRLLRASA
jgi:stage II sporulation protein AA (anti-sigma F factor antagonist)